MLSRQKGEIDDLKRDVGEIKAMLQANKSGAVVRTGTDWAGDPVFAPVGNNGTVMMAPSYGMMQSRMPRVRLLPRLRSGSCANG